MKFRLFLIILFSFWPLSVLSAPDLSISELDVRFSDPTPIAEDSVRIYASVHNISDEDARGEVRFFVNNAQIGNTQPLTVVTNERSTVFVDWHPDGEGYYNISAQISNVDPADNNLENNIVEINNFLVDLDTDNDGIFNTKDFDDDNDGVDDGLEFIAGTNPLKADTDGDGAGDKQDEFPLDPLEQHDFDKDGIGDNADTDDDNDGVLDVDDIAPFDASLPGENQQIQEEANKPAESQNNNQTESKAKVNTAPRETVQEEFTIEDIEYTFPDEASKYTLNVAIAKSRIAWNKWIFAALGVDGDDYQYVWDFGDSKFSKNKEPIHEFSGRGNYNISLTITDSDGSLGKASELVQIGFWHIGNPFLQIILSILGLFIMGLVAVLFGYNFSKKNKR